MNKEDEKKDEEKEIFDKPIPTGNPGTNGCFVSPGGDIFEQGIK